MIEAKNITAKAAQKIAENITVPKALARRTKKKLMEDQSHLDQRNTHRTKVPYTALGRAGKMSWIKLTFIRRFKYALENTNCTLLHSDLFRCQLFHNNVCRDNSI